MPNPKAVFGVPGFQDAAAAGAVGVPVALEPREGGSSSSQGAVSGPVVVSSDAMSRPSSCVAAAPPTVTQLAVPVQHHDSGFHTAAQCVMPK